MYWTGHFFMSSSQPLINICQFIVHSVKLMVVLPAKDDLLLFEAITPQTPSSDVLKQLEDISLGRSTDGASAVSIVSSNGKHNGAVNTNESPNTKLENGDYISCVASDETATYLTGEVGIGEHNGKGPSSGKIGKTRNEVVDHVLSDKNVSPSKDNSTRSALCNQGRERKTRQNVALQVSIQT